MHTCHCLCYDCHLLANVSAASPQNVQALLLPFTRGTALHNAYFRLLGARIASTAVLDAEDVSEYDLVELQDGAFVGGNTVISPGSKQAVSNKQVRSRIPAGYLGIERAGWREWSVCWTGVFICLNTEGGIFNFETL